MKSTPCTVIDVSIGIMMSFIKKSKSVTYKTLEFVDSDNQNQDQENFTGFVVIKEKGCISYIKELQCGFELTSIKLFPTKKPTILKARYGNYYEERYSNNLISAKAHIVNGELEGEYRKFNPQGKCVWVKYFNSGNDVTSEIIEFLGLTCTLETLHDYKFNTEEEFNLMMRYGSHFKFLYEYNIDSSTFDDIVLNCL
ncbi:hypothetical protein ACRYKS_26625 [Escherichia coli]|nr:hypothetical protein [Escherichia coli]EGE5776669.1 hypothetical protein [Escherichia coli]HBB3760873.1 hypothetical protein [Escherichia coli]HCJ9510060.1 hypothetical protein [Escherichia coli]